MPLYSPEALRGLVATYGPAMSWWRHVRGVVQTIVVLWLVTRFIDTNLFAHLTVCLAVIAIAEIRVSHLRSASYTEAFGMVSWQALRALHERLDVSHPPAKEQRWDRNAGVESEPFEPLDPVRWKDRVSVPLDPQRSRDDARTLRHWGTSMLHREIGNIDLARRRADFGEHGLPELDISVSHGAAFTYGALAKIAIVWALIRNGGDLLSLWSHAAILIAVAVSFTVILAVAQELPERRWHRKALLSARERGIEAALAKTERAESRASWTFQRDSGSGVQTVVACFNDPQVELYHNERRVFAGALSEDRARLIACYFFDGGDWPNVMRDGAALGSSPRSGAR